MRRPFARLSPLAAVLVLVVGCAEKDPPDPESAAPTEPAIAVEQPVATEPVPDPLTGLKMTGDWELVRGNCTACHSARLITQQRGSGDQWLAMIRWMQEKQNLWQFDPATEQRIIAYLAENYPPQAARRRAAIPPELMPPNPYSSVAQAKPQ